MECSPAGPAGLTRCAGGKSHPPKGATHQYRCKCQRSGEGRVLPGQGAPSPSRRAASAGHAGNSARCRSHSRLVDSCIVLLRCCILLLYQARERWAQDFEFIRLTWGGAKGIRTPDLLHAISRQHVHRSTSVQVIVPRSARPSRQVRTVAVLSRCTGQPARSGSQ
jgi:hypothetical protein